MQLDANAAVEDYRRRLKAQAEVVARLEELVKGLETGPAADGGAQTEGQLRRARADLERAEKALKALKRQYAAFRLTEALGPDSLHLDDAAFNEAILAVTSSRLSRREARGPMDGPIAFEAFRTLFLSEPALAQLVENEQAERSSRVAFEGIEEQTSTKNILRRWAAAAASDPYVANILRCAAQAAATFRQCLAEFSRRLDGLRINYELKQRRVDRLIITIENGQAAIQAANYWENVERACPEEAAELVRLFHGLDQAREELRRMRDELNGELRAFMSCFFPRYLGHALRLPKARRQALGLGRARPRRLCAYVLEQIERTDFLLPRGGELEIEVPRIPAEIADFRKLKAYARFKRQSEPEGEPGEE